MSFKRESLLVFKDENEAKNFCKLANSNLPKLQVYNHSNGKMVQINDYVVKLYPYKKPINNLISIKTIFGNAYLIG